MKLPFIIYIRAVGIYPLLTIPALIFPIMYIISMMYVLFYGWFAWALFTIIYLITIFCNPSYLTKMIILILGVVVSVLFAFEMLEILGAEKDIWNSGGFLLFPFAAIFSGWISLVQSRKKIEAASRNVLLEISETIVNEQNIS